MSRQRSYITVTLEEDVDINDFDPAVILEAAAKLGLQSSTVSLAEAAYVAVITNRADDERAICRKLIEEITGRII